MCFVCYFFSDLFLTRVSFKGIANNIQMREQTSSLETQSSSNDSIGLSANSYVNERHRDLAISAVLMDEWLKELSAISQELSIVLLNENLKR